MILKKEKYIEFKNKDGEVVVAECLLLDDEDNWARGVAIWNRDTDPFSKTIGRSAARFYAIRALRGKANKVIDRFCIYYPNDPWKIDSREVLNEFSSDNAINKLMEVRCPFLRKGELNPELSWFERRVLFGRRKFKNIAANKKTTMVTYTATEKGWEETCG